MSKSELIESYNKGELKDFGVYVLTNSHAMVIVHIDDREEKVFGYFTGENKDYFYVKYRILDDDTSFKVNGRTYRFSQFMRI